MAALARSEEARWYLQYLADHENDAIAALGGYAQRAKGRVLETWVAFPPDESTWRTVDRVHWHRDMTLEDVYEAALLLQETLVEAYSVLRHEADTEEVATLFSGLCECAEAERNRCALGALRRMG